jgi:hypothetical protein
MCDGSSFLPFLVFNFIAVSTPSKNNSLLQNDARRTRVLEHHNIIIIHFSSCVTHKNDSLCLNRCNTMNVGLLDCMIRPLGHDRVNQQQGILEQEDSSSHTSKCVSQLSEPEDSVFPPEQPTRKNSSIAAGKSLSIPISPNKMRRTASEIQLHEDEALADWRDYVMYSRIVNGMNEKRAQRMMNHGRRRHHHKSSTDQCLANIIRTRNLPVEDGVDMSPTSSSCYFHPTGAASSTSFGSCPNGMQQRSPYLLDLYGGDVAEHANDEERDEGIFVLDDL